MGPVGNLSVTFHQPRSWSSPAPLFPAKGLRVPAPGHTPVRAPPSPRPAGLRTNGSFAGVSHPCVSPFPSGHFVICILLNGRGESFSSLKPLSHPAKSQLTVPLSAASLCARRRPLASEVLPCPLRRILAPPAPSVCWLSPTCRLGVPYVSLPGNSFADILRPLLCAASRFTS